MLRVKSLVQCATAAILGPPRSLSGEFSTQKTLGRVRIRPSGIRSTLSSTHFSVKESRAPLGNYIRLGWHGERAADCVIAATRDFLFSERNILVILSRHFGISRV